MRVTRNGEVAAMLWELAQAMTLRRDAFRARAYQRAARAIEDLPQAIETLTAQGRLTSIPAVGAGIAAKIDEFLRTGRVAALEEARQQMPTAVPDLMTVPGLGPRRALQLAQELKLASLDDLQAALQTGKVRKLKGFGVRSEKAIVAALATRDAAARRVPFADAQAVGQRIVAYLTAKGHHVVLAGSLRRGRDTVGDLDLLARGSGTAAAGTIAALLAYPGVGQVIEKGSTRARVRLRDGTGVDLRVLPAASLGAGLLYFTGSKQHNIELRQRALGKGWSLNESSLHDGKTGRVLAGKTEGEVYRKLGLDFVPPELREGHGELDEAAAHRLPTLIEEADLRGDLHVHTDASDGRHTLAVMAKAAASRGYAYLGVSDHGETLRIANGLNGARYAEQRRAMHAAQEDHPTMALLQGGEIDILKDGRLGLDAVSLRRLDYVVGSVHGAFRLAPAEQTKRLLSAITGGIDILGHPSGRMFPRRAGMDADWPRIYQACKDNGVLLEVDGTPDRLDLPGEQVRVARELGCLFTVDSDAHATGELDQVRYGVIQARRGGLERRHVANAGTLRALRRHFGHAQRR